MLKRVYALQLTYDVSGEEKKLGEKALLYFDEADRLLNIALTQLDIMGVAFKDHPDIDTKEIIEFRRALRRYRDQTIENFKNFKIAASHCMSVMQPFISDTQVLKLIKLFSSSVEEISDQVSKFYNIFDNLESKSFVNDINTAINDIKKICEELKETIHDRIEDYIKNNIIGKSWLDGVSDQMQVSVQRQTPLVIDLFKHRQKQLKEIKRMPEEKELPNAAKIQNR